MLHRITLIACMALLAGCTETGDSPYTYLDVSDPGTPDTSGGVYWVHAEPLLTKACNGCHTGGSSGGNNFASVYEDNLKPSYYCAGQLVGECVTVRIDDGTMPPGGSSNLTAEERAVLDAWIEAGMPFEAGGGPVEDIAPEDTTAQDTVEEDSGPEDVTVEDAGVEDAGVEDAGAEDAGAEDAGATDVEPEPAGPTYTNDIQPMLATGGWCVGCHTGGTSGGSNFASVYEDNLKPSYYCAGKMVGECILPRIDDNSMPPGGGLAVTDEQRALLEDWVAAGLPE
jgi:hypothetical protein